IDEELSIANTAVAWWVVVSIFFTRGPNNKKQISATKMPRTKASAELIVLLQGASCEYRNQAYRAPAATQRSTNQTGLVNRSPDWISGEYLGRHAAVHLQHSSGYIIGHSTS